MAERFDPKKADPIILRQYTDMRNQRRMSDIVLPLALMGKGLFFLTFVGVMLFDMSGNARTNIIFGVMTTYLVVVFTMCVAWAQVGKRLLTMLVIVSFITVVMIASALTVFIR